MTSLDLKKSLEISKAGDQPNGTLKPRYSIKRGLKLVAYSTIFRPPSDGGLMIPPWTKNDV